MRAALFLGKSSCLVQWLSNHQSQLFTPSYASLTNNVNLHKYDTCLPCKQGRAAWTSSAACSSTAARCPTTSASRDGRTMHMWQPQNSWFYGPLYCPVHTCSHKATTWEWRTWWASHVRAPFPRSSRWRRRGCVRASSRGSCASATDASPRYSTDTKKQDPFGQVSQDELCQIMIHLSGSMEKSFGCSFLILLAECLSIYQKYICEDISSPA